MNVRDLAVHVTKREGLKVSVSVAQVREIIRILAIVFAEEHVDGNPDSWEHFREYAYKFTKTVKRDKLNK